MQNKFKRQLLQAASQLQQQTSCAKSALQDSDHAPGLDLWPSAWHSTKVSIVVSESKQQQFGGGTSHESAVTDVQVALQQALTANLEEMGQVSWTQPQQHTYTNSTGSPATYGARA